MAYEFLSRSLILAEGCWWTLYGIHRPAWLTPPPRKHRTKDDAHSRATWCQTSRACSSFFIRGMAHEKVRNTPSSLASRSPDISPGIVSRWARNSSVRRGDDAIHSSSICSADLSRRCTRAASELSAAPMALISFRCRTCCNENRDDEAISPPRAATSGPRICPVVTRPLMFRSSLSDSAIASRS